MVTRRLQESGLHRLEPPRLLDDLLAYIEKPNPSTLLVLTGAKLPGAEGGMDRGRRLENRVGKMGGLLKFAAKEVRPLDFARAYVRTAAEVFDEVVLLAAPDVLAGDDGGNLVLVAL